MASKVILSVGAVAIIGASSLGMHLSKTALQQQIANLNSAPIGTQDIAFKIDTVSDNFFVQRHKITLSFRANLLEFTQSVTFLPWGAKGNIDLVQEGQFFNELRKNTTFIELPLNVDWQVNGLTQIMILNADLAAFNVKSTQPDDNFQFSSKPAFIQITSDLDGANTLFRTAIQGYKISNDELDITLTSLTMDSSSKKTKSLLRISDTVIRLADIKITNHNQRKPFKSFQLSRLSNTMTSNFVAQALSLKSEVKIGDITVKHAPTSPEIAEHLSLENIAIKASISNIGSAFLTHLKAFNPLQLTDSLPNQADINNLGDAFFSENKKVTLNLSTDNLNITLNGQQSSGAINLAGTGKMSPIEFQQLVQHGPQLILNSLYCELDVSVARSVADFASQFLGMPYAPFIEQGFAVDAVNSISTHIEYDNNQLKANGKLLMM